MEFTQICFHHIENYRNHSYGYQVDTSDYLHNFLHRNDRFNMSLQETHQELADRLKLHVVEIRKEHDYLPVVVASPSDGEVTKEPPPKEELNFETLYFDGKMSLQKGKKRPFYAENEGHKRAERHRRMLRIQRKARHERMIYELEPPIMPKESEDS